MSGWYEQWEKVYLANKVLLWPNLGRLNNLLVIVNISMFFLSGLVAKGYFYTFFSLSCLGAVAILLLLPFSFMERLWYYLICISLEFTAMYFLVASIIYWVRSGGTI